VRLIVWASLAVVLLGSSPSPTALLAQADTPEPTPTRHLRRQQAPLPRMPLILQQQVPQQAPLPAMPAAIQLQGTPAAAGGCATAVVSPSPGAALPADLADFVPHGGADDATVCRAMRLQAIMAQKAAYEYYANDVTAYHLRAQIFQNQAVATNVILVLVLVITLAGLVFSGIQFWVALTTHKASLAAHEVVLQQAAAGGAAAASPAAAGTAPAAAAAADDAATLATQLKVGMDGVQLQSSVLGTTILVFSLAFLYLYLKFVYPINDVTMSNPPATPTPAAATAAK
jgi:hypothetical protein